jgi:hypothetical protein
MVACMGTTGQPFLTQWLPRIHICTVLTLTARTKRLICLFLCGRPFLSIGCTLWINFKPKFIQLNMEPYTLSDFFFNVQFLYIIRIRFEFLNSDIHRSFLLPSHNKHCDYEPVSIQYSTVYLICIDWLNSALQSLLKSFHKFNCIRKENGMVHLTSGIPASSM